MRGNGCLLPPRLLAEPPAKEAELPCSVAPHWYAGFCRAHCMLRYLSLGARGICKRAPFCDRVMVGMWIEHCSVCQGG